MTTLPGYRGTHTSPRQRLQLVSAAAIIAVVVGAVAVTVRLAGAGGPDPWVVGLAAAALLPLGVAAGASLRMRREAGRVLAVSTELGAIALVELVGLGVLVLALGRVPDEDERVVVLPALAAVGVGALVYPSLRSHLTRAARRTSSGLRRTPEEVLEAFGDRTMRGVSVEELLLQLAESLRYHLALRTVEIWTGDGRGLQRLLSVPHRSAAATGIGAHEAEVLRRAGVAGEAWLRLWLPRLLVGRGDGQLRVAPASHGGDLLGLVLVERAADEERFSAADERMLGEVVRRLGVVLHNRQLDSALQATLDDLRRTNEELRASRTRLVAAADEERRRIERDIHDGAQQHLVALAVNLSLARQGLHDDPDSSAELLDEMATSVRETIQQVRDLAHGIYPPLLREAGLGEALRAAAARHPQPVSVDAVEVRRHEPDVEAAVYFCCLEALQNAGKHAPGAAVTVRVWEDGVALRFTVADDGPGLSETSAAAGQGRQNMTDRLGAVGGLVTWAPASSDGVGVRVTGEVPLAASGA